MCETVVNLKVRNVAVELIEVLEGFPAFIRKARMNQTLLSIPRFDVV